jgi:hypothetical protein
MLSVTGEGCATQTAVASALATANDEIVVINRCILKLPIPGRLEPLSIINLSVSIATEETLTQLYKLQRNISGIPTAEDAILRMLAHPGKDPKCPARSLFRISASTIAVVARDMYALTASDPGSEMNGGSRSKMAWRRLSHGIRLQEFCGKHGATTCEILSKTSK